MTLPRASLVALAVATLAACAEPVSPRPTLPNQSAGASFASATCAINSTGKRLGGTRGL